MSEIDGRDPISVAHVPEERYAGEVKQEFESLAGAVNKIFDNAINLHDGHYHSDKDSLAFLVEAEKQLEPRNWKKVLQNLKNKLTGCDKMDASWLLFQMIRDAYTTSLTLKMAQAEKDGDKEEMENLDTLMGLYTLLHGETEESYKKGMAITYGGVHRVYLPQWYKNHYIDMI